MNAPKIFRPLNVMMTSLSCVLLAVPAVAVDAPSTPAIKTAPPAPAPQTQTQTMAIAQAPSSETIGKAAVDYFKNHPEAFVEVIAAVQAHAKKTQETAQAESIAKYSSDLFSQNANIPLLGNPQGTNEVVLFMDPFCHFCRKFEPILLDAIKADPNLKIISRDIAIMSDKSALLIKATLAAANQGKYADMMQAVHKMEPTVTEKDVLKVAKSLKLNMEKFKADMANPDTDAQIKANMDLAQNLGISGTPTFIVKSSLKLNAGYVSLEDFQKAVQQTPATPEASRVMAQQAPVDQNIIQSGATPSAQATPQTPAEQRPSVRLPSPATPSMAQGSSAPSAASTTTGPAVSPASPEPLKG